MDRNVFDQARSLVPISSLESSTSSTAEAADPGRIPLLVKLAESKGQYSQLQREICGLRDHLSVEALVDAESMRGTKRDLDHATATLQVSFVPSRCGGRSGEGDVRGGAMGALGPGAEY